MKLSISEDPRHSTGFRSELYPRCDGLPAPPPGTQDPVQQRMIAFAAAYYRINACLEKRRQAMLNSDEELALFALEDYHKAVRLRDELEDAHAPEGFYAEAELEGLFTVNLIFNHALKQQVHSEASGNFNLFIPVPLPGTDIEEHLWNHLSHALGFGDEVSRADEETTNTIVQANADNSPVHA